MWCWRYSEKVTVPATKAYLTFKGAGANSTTIQYGDDATKAGSTAKSASVIILSDFFIAEDIAFKVSKDEQQSLNSHLVEILRSPSSSKCEILINWSYTITKFPVVSDVGSMTILLLNQNTIPIL